MKSRLVILLFFVCAISAASDDARALYDKAVNAYDQGDYLQALSFIDRAIALAPNDQQASKMKLVIEAALHPADASTSSSDNGWTYSYGEGGIEIDPEFVRVYPLSSQPISEPSYATYSLGFPKNSVEWEADFKLRFGRSGDLRTGVSLRQKEKTLVSLAGDGGKGMSLSAGTSGGTCQFAPGWHECKVWWRAGSVEVWVDGRKQWSAPQSGIPDLLVFGPVAGKEGVEAEAFLKWEGASYNVPAG